jgi:hypothetical protein
MGCCGEDDWVVDVAEIPVPTVFEKLFFEKVARLIQYTCDCNPEYSMEAFDWDWASFHKNILLPKLVALVLFFVLAPPAPLLQCIAMATEIAVDLPAFFVSSISLWVTTTS